jgi:hypothetical protein
VWDVADEDFDRTLVDYALLSEREYLEDVQEQDARYHLAMMIAQGFGGGAEVVWAERNQWRGSLNTPASQSAPPRMSRDEHMALALDIERRLKAAGVIH